MGTITWLCSEPLSGTHRPCVPIQPIPFICPIHLDGHVFNKKNGAWCHVHGLSVLERTVIFLGFAAVSPLREMHPSHCPSVFTPSGGPLIAPSVHCRRPEWGNGPRPVLGRLELGRGQEDEW